MSNLPEKDSPKTDPNDINLQDSPENSKGEELQTGAEILHNFFKTRA